MTAHEWSWVVIGVNLWCAALNGWGFWRYWRLVKELKALKAEAEANIAQHEAQIGAHKAALEDFTERMMKGEVVVTTDEGAVGQLTIVPEGAGNVRIHITPVEHEHIH